MFWLQNAQNFTTTIVQSEVKVKSQSKMSIDISLVIEKVQDSHDSDVDEEEIDRTKFFSPGDIITK